MPAVQTAASGVSDYWAEKINSYLWYAEVVRKLAPTSVYQKKRHLFMLAALWPDDARLVTSDLLESSLGACFDGEWNYNRALIDTKGFWTWLRAKKFCGNKAKGLKPRRIKSKSRTARNNLLTQRQAYALFEAHDDEARFFMRQIVMILFWTGMRPAQVLRMKREDVRDEASRPHVVVQRGKTSPYEAPLIHRDATSAAIYLSELARAKLVPSARRRALLSEWSAVHPGLPPITFESFRKTRANIWLQRHPEIDVAKWLGTSVGMLRRFYHVSDSRNGAWPDMAD